MSIKEFMKKHFRHFNAAVCVEAAEGWVQLLKENGKMMLTMAGAMSTAELGISVAEMIRKDKVHIICCTGANLEEDIFNLVAHSHYKRIPNYRSLTPQDDYNLLQEGMNRVTDTCIPEETAVRRIDDILLKICQEIDRKKERYFPYEYIYKLLDDKSLQYEIDPAHSWVLAAKEKNMPIFTPGWEDSTLGNIFTSYVITKKISDYSIVKTGIEQMIRLAEWYESNSLKHKIGFFQIGGGIAGDFPICVVPMLRHDLEREVPLWSYFCQISDSTTSLGSYSGAVPSEKITWGKLDVDTRGYVIESDATIVAPLVFQYVLDE